jgi:hypothetical protein
VSSFDRLNGAVDVGGALQKVSLALERSSYRLAALCVVVRD